MNASTIGMTTTMPPDLWRTAILYDHKDGNEEKLEKQYLFVHNLLEKISSDREATENLTQHAAKGNVDHDDVINGLLCKVLMETQRKEAAKYWYYLTMVTRDGMNAVTNTILSLINSKFHRLNDIPRLQCVFVANEIAQLQHTKDVDIICSLLRQIVGGDQSERNIMLCEHMLEMLNQNYAWMSQRPIIIQSTVYTYLRILQDHLAAEYVNLRNKEVNFVAKLMRDRWDDCAQIGKEMVRLLHALLPIREMKSILDDIINRPGVLSPSFGGFLSLMRVRTSKKFIMNRIHPDLEKKIRFLLNTVNKVKVGRYQEYLYRRHLSTAASDTLRADIVRFVCTCIHPTNEILASDITPRYALLGWLLILPLSGSAHNAATNTYQINAALYWDWFVYHEQTGMIMDIEPGLLVMYHNIRSKQLTSKLLDFLCRQIREFPTNFQQQFQLGVQASFTKLLSCRVVQNLAPIMETTRNNPELVIMARASFGKHFNCSSSDSGAPLPPPIPIPVQPVPAAAASSVLEIAVVDRIARPKTPTTQHEPPEHETPTIEDDSDMETNKQNEEHASFSDDDDDDEDETITNTSNQHTAGDKRKNSVATSSEDEDGGGDKAAHAYSKALKKLDGTFQELFNSITTSDDSQDHCDKTQKVISHALLTEDWDEDKIGAFSACLIHVNNPILTEFTLNDSELTTEYLESCVGNSMFLIFRNVWDNRRDEEPFQILLNILSDMYSQAPKIGYLFLFYLAVLNPKKWSDGFNLYKSFARRTQLSDLYNCLMMDLKTCQESDTNMLVYLTPYVFKTFPDSCLENSELFNIIVAVLGPLQLEQLQYMIMMGEFVMMNKESVVNLLESSLEWESFEQYATWQLMSAHDIPFDIVLPLLQRLDPKAHAEALSSILITLKLLKPTQDIVQHLVSRRCIDVDRFTVSLLRHWAIKHPKELAEHLSVVLSKSKPRQLTQPRKSLRPRSHAAKRAQQSLAAQPSTTDMLTHVDNLRKLPLPKSCEFFQQDSLIACLLHMQENFDEPCKSKFNDLFAIASRFDTDDDDNITLSSVRLNARKRGKPGSGRVNAGMRSKGSNSKVSYNQQQQDSAGGDSDDSEENCTFQPKRKRRGRPAANESSDSE